MPIYRLPEEPIFPDPALAEESGLIAIGGDLNAERLLNAYATGIFPWYSEGQPILWHSPDPRMIFLPGDFQPSKSLERVIKSGKFTVRADTRFAEVIEACASVPRPGQAGTWITDDMIAAYCDLHARGFAHSVETYRDDELVGGLYGVSLGRAFFGESMFHLERDASKVAFAELVDFAQRHCFHFIDGQVPNDHLARLGARQVSRPDFLKRLAKALRSEAIPGPWSLPRPSENNGS